MFGEMSDQTVYIACSLTDSSDRFTVPAESLGEAQYTLLDKLGYVVMYNKKQFHLCDADTMEKERVLEATSMEEAFNAALLIAKWKILDPMELVGGRMGGGFSIEVRPE